MNLLARLAALAALIGWFLTLGASWACSAAGIPAPMLAAAWRFGLCVWLVLWFSCTAPLKRRKFPPSDKAAKPPAPGAPVLICPECGVARWEPATDGYVCGHCRDLKRPKLGAVGRIPNPDLAEAAA